MMAPSISPGSGSTESDNDGTFDTVAPPGGIDLEHILAGEDKTRTGVTSTARLTADPDGMVPWRFIDGCVRTDTRRMVALSSAMMASTAGQARSIHQFLLWRWLDGRWRQHPLGVRRSGV
ncbi:Kinesin-4 [Hordeum vulgare]|nr:Kinesin-4 [Hordeum vulgare]